jgi:hypothetical protein
MFKLLLSFLTCAVSFPKKVMRREWPSIVDEPVDHQGGLIHRLNNIAVETVRANANFFTKGLAFTNLMTLLLLILAWGV